MAQRARASSTEEGGRESCGEGEETARTGRKRHEERCTQSAARREGQHGGGACTPERGEGGTERG